MSFLMFLQVYPRLSNVTNVFDLDTLSNYAAAVRDVVIVVRASTLLTKVLLYK
jgi:hypothetical protein